MRATMDGDLVAMIFPAHAKMLARTLGPGWYADPETMDQSIREGRSFNLIHVASAMKFDLFPATSEFHQVQLDRATATPLQVEGADACPVATPEDILLAKLQWYRDGGEVSDRQWNDIGGLIATNPAMDWEYVNHWAERLGVTSLLARARAEAAE
jgi:hypothetical protein